MNGSSPSHPQPMVNGGDSPSESKQLIDLESKSVGDSTSDTRDMNGNKTDDEKTSSLQMPANNDAYATNREREASWFNAEEITTKPSLVEETVLVATAPTAQSSATSRMDGLFLKLDEDEGFLGNQARYGGCVCLSVCLPVCLSLCEAVSKTRTGREISDKRRSNAMMFVSVCPAVLPSVCLSVRSSVSHSVSPFVCLFVCLSVCLFVSVSVFVCLRSFALSFPHLLATAHSWNNC